MGRFGRVGWLASDWGAKSKRRLKTVENIFPGAVTGVFEAWIFECFGGAQVETEGRRRSPESIGLASREPQATRSRRFLRGEALPIELE